MELNKIHNIDCIKGIKLLDDESCDICITSPPYKEKDGWHEHLMEYVCYQVYRVLKPNSLFFLNFGHLAENKFRPFYACSDAITKGFKLNDTITWEKTQFSPIQGSRRLNNLTEFIFLLYKGKMPKLDRLSIGVPYKDKSNIGRYSNIDLRCGGNHWKFGYETIQSKKQKLHNDRFPLELPLRCLKLANLKPNSLVLEPFAGSGTTCKAATQLNHRFIGFDINKKYAT